MVARWRGAGVIERAQLKWFYAGALWMTLVVFVVLIPPDDPRPAPLLDAVGGALVATAFWALPLAVMVAVTRYRLFDIDRVISRTVAYTLVAGALGAIYVATVVGLQALLPVRGSDVAIAGSTLAAAAAFGPVRRRIQRAVDRRFNRARYEVALVAGAFAERVRREVDVDAIAGALAVAVGQSVQPADVRLWLRARAGADGAPGPVWADR